MPIPLALGVPDRRPDLWDGLVRDGPGESGAAGETGLAAARTDELCVALVRATHDGLGGSAGLVVSCRSADEVARVLTAAVAALTGEDVRAAFDTPDLDRVCALGRGAREAIRDVVALIVVPAGDLDGVMAGLPPEALLRTARPG